jgi:hypothetical protein
MKLLDCLEELLEKATPGPWQLDSVGDDIEGKNGKSLLLTCGDAPCFRIDEDAQLIVLAINALPELIALARIAETVVMQQNDKDHHRRDDDPDVHLLKQAIADLNAKDTP